MDCADAKIGVQGLAWPTNVSSQGSSVDKSVFSWERGDARGLLSSVEALLAFPKGSVLFTCGAVGNESTSALTDGIDFSLSNSLVS